MQYGQYVANVICLVTFYGMHATFVNKVFLFRRNLQYGVYHEFSGRGSVPFSV